MGSIGPEFWMLWFGDDATFSVSGADAAALIAAANGQRAAIRPSKRVLSKKEFEDLLEEGRESTDVG